MTTTSQAQQTSIGGYRITGTLGAGGMGVVYVAEHELLRRKAAVKVLLAELSNDHDVVNRFFKEAKAAAAIKHPGIVKVYDFGHQDDGSAYIAMELMDGEGLDVRIKRSGPLPVQQALRFAGQMASVLAAAHSHGIVHRDLKPANVFIVKDPQVPGGERIKLLDFGIAKFAVTDDPDAKQTRAGAILGSPQYMAPEQIRGARDVDHRADLYSVGCMLFEMLCGRPPFDGGGNGAMAVMASHLDDPPPIPSSLRAEIARELDALILYLLAKEPAQRYQSAADLGAALAAISGEQVSFGSLPGVTAQISAVTTSVPTGVALGPTGAPLTSSQITSQMQTGALTATGQRSSQTTVTGASMSRRRGLAIGAAVAVVIGGGAAGFAALGSKKKTISLPAPVVAEAKAAPATPPPPRPEERLQHTYRQIVMPAPADGTSQDVEVVVELMPPADQAPVWTAGSLSIGRFMTGAIFQDIVSTIKLRIAPPATITWRIASEPSRAEIIENGKVIGRTPLTIKILENPDITTRYTLRADGYDDATIDLHGGASWAEVISLAAKIAITIESKPRGAAVLDAGGRMLATTPGKVLLSRSDQPSALTLRLEGYEDRSVEVVPDKDKKEQVELIKLRATITHRIVTEPSGATVTRGSEEIGTTPLEHSFLEEKGAVKYTLELEGHQQRTVRLDGARSGDETVTLKKCEGEAPRRSRADPLLGRPELVRIYDDPC